MARNDPMEISVHLHFETDGAILVSDDGNRSQALWLPKSQITMPTRYSVNASITIEIQEWLAIDKGLV
jgi:hypothetical protein